MFRIKTDIKHFKCDSRDKVERLIRNWVIRPSDLIYDDDGDYWRPIGQHPSFAKIFASLDGTYEEQPDTVITDRAAKTAAADREYEPNGATDAASPAPDDSQRPKSAILKPSRGDDKSDDEAEQPPQAAVLRPGPAATPEPEPETGEPEPEAGEPEPETGEPEPEAGEPEPEAGEPEPEPLPPEPSPDVIGVIRDSDEITMMTDRTLNMLMVDGPSRPKEDSVTASEETRTAAPDEPTQLTERPDFDDEYDAVASDEPTQLTERPDFDDEHVPVAADEPTQRSERPDFDDENEPPTPEATAPTPSDDEGPEVVPRRRPGRHGLPEEAFTTAEISSAEVDDDDEPIDELGALEAEDATQHDAPMGSPREAKSNWNIILGDMPADDEDADSGGDDPVDPLRETEEIEIVDRGDVAASDEDDTVDLRKTDQMFGDATDLASAPADEVDDEQQYVLEEIAQKSEDDATRGDEEDDTTQPLEIDDEALDDAFDDLEESAIAARQADEEQEEDLAEIPIVEAVRDPDAVSEGYHVDFLFPVGPTDHALALGIERSQISEKRRDLYFSRPEPKKGGELVQQTYQLDEPSGQQATLPLSELGRLPLMLATVAAIVVLFLLVLAAAC